MRVGKWSPSGLKLLLKVTSVKWKAHNIYCWNYYMLGGNGIIIHVASSHGKKGVGLYGKYNYYLICIEKIVRGVTGYNMRYWRRVGLTFVSSLSG
jgi:hypothetical protein